MGGCKDGWGQWARSFKDFRKLRIIYQSLERTMIIWTERVRRVRLSPEPTNVLLSSKSIYVDQAIRWGHFCFKLKAKQNKKGKLILVSSCCHQYFFGIATSLYISLSTPFRIIRAIGLMKPFFFLPVSKCLLKTADTFLMWCNFQLLFS